MRERLVPGGAGFVAFLLIASTSGAQPRSEFIPLEEQFVYCPAEETYLFELEFNREPVFFGLDTADRQANEFRFRICYDSPYDADAHEIVIPGPGPGAGFGSIEILNRNGTIRGSVPYELNGARLRFSIPAPLIGDPDGVVSYELSSYTFGATNSSYESQSRVACSAESPCDIGGTSPIAGTAYVVKAVSGLAFVAAREAGLQVLDVSDPGTPTVIGSFESQGNVLDVAVSGTHAFITDSELGLVVLDVSDPAHPEERGSLKPAGIPVSLAVSGDYVLLTHLTPTFSWNNDAHLEIIDVSSPETPMAVGQSVSLAENAEVYRSEIVVVGSYAYVLAENLSIVDISNPLQAVRRGRTLLPRGAQGLAVHGNHAYVTAFGSYWAGVLSLVDVSDPDQPTRMHELETPNMANDAITIGERLYVGYGGTRGAGPGVQLYDLTDPGNPAPLGMIGTPGPARGLAALGNRVYVAGDDTGLQVLTGECVDDVVPTLLSSLSATVVGDAIRIRWTVATGTYSGFHVERALLPGESPRHELLNAGSPVPGNGPWEYLDTEALPGHRYSYRLSGLTRAGGTEILGSIEASLQPVGRLLIRSPQPNPVATETSIAFQVPRRSVVTLSLFDIRGREVATLFEGPVEPGAHRIPWDGRDGRGRSLPSGIYFTRLASSDGEAVSGKLVLAR